MNGENRTTAQHQQNGNDDEPGESLALISILGDNSGTAVAKFFESTWQEQCALFRWGRRCSLQANNNSAARQTNANTTIGEPTDFHASNFWNDDAVRNSPYEELIDQGWIALVQLLADAPIPPSNHNDNTVEHVIHGSTQHTAPLLFKDKVSVTNDLATSYNNNLMTAYLDGCSVVLNHADWTSPWIAAVCQDLQKSFPHVFTNAYLTPPGAQAVRAHADDRDVFIIQVVGKKQWTVYQKVPIPYPYPHEQVGKERLEVPQEVLEGPKIIQTTLQPGDVMYMPRGYVHEALTHEDSCSFHVTIALATHDWTLAGILTAATESILHSVVDYRKALPRTIGGQNIKQIPLHDQEQLQQQIQQAFQRVQEEVTVAAISESLGNKFHRHNHRAFSVRMKSMHAMRFPSESAPPRVIVGPRAARLVALDSLVRAATPEEKASVIVDKPRGLLPREEIAGAIVFILRKIKEAANREFVVKDLRSLLPENVSIPNVDMICPLTLLSFARVCVEQGAIALVYR
ncbi:demethylase and histidyl-hydroxylase NO66 [Seminavis robusta]|uniref:Bifunctional lysine-specific demethylase and histidyl-hydroxylase n=1 Tax=Seminavis robusta TaxID=568900 RepID=A0A9N8DGP7_9STRA|nr:demethylase and histidyl-hydroxylase NO66 [Seminavis robusta]|eukprot:Sro83_g044220.1 demethylase and histidyl-hydroxylase NO66 (515) ;mRNA; r:21668-23212